MATTLAQQQALAIAPKFTAALSVMGSGIISYLIIRNPGQHRRRTYHRLMLGMSLCDVFASTAFFFTTWPIPVGTDGVYGAVGNQQTCSAQGFFAQFSLSTVMYNGALAVYYVLIIVKGWKDDDIAKLEPAFHVHSLLWGLGTAVAGLALGLFNHVGWDCWISASPLGCEESWKNNGETTCERGDNGSLYQWAFYYAPLWAVITVVSALMVWVYRFVLRSERAMDRYVSGSVLPATTATTRADDGADPSSSYGDPSITDISTQQLPTTIAPLAAEESFAETAQKIVRPQRKHSKKIANQGMAYVGAFFAAWTFPTIFQLVLVTSGKIYFWLLFLTAFSVPCQGFFNLLVFIRPKYLRCRKVYSEQSFLATFFYCLWKEITKGGSLSKTGVTTVDKPDDVTPEATEAVRDDHEGPKRKAERKNTFRASILDYSFWRRAELDVHADTPGRNPVQTNVNQDTSDNGVA